jgi:hypothetical protein
MQIAFCDIDSEQGIFTAGDTGLAKVVVNPCAIEPGSRYPGGLAGKLVAITNLFSILAGPLRPREGVVFGEILVDLYADHGIQEDPRSHRLQPPTFAELIERLRYLTPANRYVRDLMDRLDGWEDNPLASFVAGSQRVVGDKANLQVLGLSPREGAFLTCASLEGYPRGYRSVVLHGPVGDFRIFEGAANTIDHHVTDSEPDAAEAASEVLEPGKEHVAL